jgi:RNA-binding protein
MESSKKELSEKQKKHLRGLAHPLTPLARLGQAGVSDAFLAELERTLDHHELVKLKVSAADREARDKAIGEVVARTGAVLVSRVGNVAVLYRRNREAPRLVLPE